VLIGQGRDFDKVRLRRKVRRVVDDLGKGTYIRLTQELESILDLLPGQEPLTEDARDLGVRQTCDTRFGAFKVTLPSREELQGGQYKLVTRISEVFTCRMSSSCEATVIVTARARFPNPSILFCFARRMAFISRGETSVYA
jgi:hypothetical protein